MERSFHIRNRQELYRTIPDHSLFVCFAGRILPQSADAEYPFFANRNFAYLTGLDGAEVHDFVFLARKEGEAVEETVFALPPDAMAERWTGRRLKEDEIRSRSGVKRVLPAERFSAVFHAAAERSRTVVLDLWKKSPEDPDTEAFRFAAALDYFAAYAEDIAGPRLLGSVGFVEAEFGVVVDVDRVYAHFFGAVCAYFCHNYLVDSAGEHEAAVIVGVFADEIDASGRRVYGAVAAEAALEYAVDVLLELHDNDI